MASYMWDSYRSVLFLSVTSFNIGDIFNMTVSCSVFELDNSEMGANSINGEQKSKLKFDPMPHNDGFLIKLQAYVGGMHMFDQDLISTLATSLTMTSFRCMLLNSRIVENILT